MASGTAVITGANSGIGHAFAQVLIKEGWRVIAVDRDVGDKLKSLGCNHAQLDVSSPSSIESFKQKHFGNEQPIDLLLNIAGVMSPWSQDKLDTTSLDTLEKTFRVNTFGPLLLTQALLPNLLKSTADSRRVAIMSSRVGSMSDNSSGGMYAYRASKSAVNSIGKSMSVDLAKDGIVVSLLHPGVVYTNMTAGVPMPPEAVEPEEAATKLFKVLQEKGVKKENSGKFWHREGFELPW